MFSVHNDWTVLRNFENRRESHVCPSHKHSHSEIDIFSIDSLYFRLLHMMLLATIQVATEISKKEKKKEKKGNKAF